MKKHLLTWVVILVIGIPVFSQTTTTKTVFVPRTYPVTTTVLKLNGQLRGAIGGKPRSAMKIYLPPNTIEWHYSFSTKRDSSFSRNLKLAAQLMSILATVATDGASGAVFSGLTTAATKSIQTPGGLSHVNAYVLSDQNINNFLAENAFNYYINSSLLNVNNGRMQVPYFGTSIIYVGFENLGDWHGIFVDLEIVAIVKEMKIITENVQSNSTNQSNNTFNKNDFIGRWKDENSTFTLSRDGNFYMEWDNGKSAHGRWDLINNKLNLDFSVDPSNSYRQNDFYNILFFDGTHLRSQGNGADKTIYNATKQ